MPIYLVRWPDLSAALVSAPNEDELLDTLDELDDTEGATWAVYRGPLWVEFEVPAAFRVMEKASPGAQRAARELLHMEHLEIEDVSRLEPGAFEVSIAEADTGSAMAEEIYRRAFPNIHGVLYGREPESEQAANEALESAVRAELKQLVEARWRIANRERRTDDLGRLAAYMRAPVRWVENSLLRSGKLPPKDPAAPPSHGAVHQLPGTKRRRKHAPRKR